MYRKYGVAEKIWEIANRKGYRTDSDAPSVLNYTTEEVNLMDGQPANIVTSIAKTSNKANIFFIGLYLLILGYYILV